MHDVKQGYQNNKQELKLIETSLKSLQRSWNHSANQSNIGY